MIYVPHIENEINNVFFVSKQSQVLDITSYVDLHIATGFIMIFKTKDSEVHIKQLPGKVQETGKYLYDLKFDPNGIEMRDITTLTYLVFLTYIKSAERSRFIN